MTTPLLQLAPSPLSPLPLSLTGCWGEECPGLTGEAAKAAGPRTWLRTWISRTKMYEWKNAIGIKGTELSPTEYMSELLDGYEASRPLN